MRMRRKKHGKERLEACGNLIITVTDEVCTDARDYFGNENPVHLEIGCGKGDFVFGMAQRYPDINFIAIEKISDVMVIAAEKIKASGLSNIKFLCCDAAKIPAYFKKGSIERIYLNFSDPWPKKGYAKRRLTHKNYLDVYKAILPDNGSVFFKTDNRGLFDFSVEEFSSNGFRLQALTYDLHASEFAGENILTEYERNFSEKGFKINRVEAYLI